MKKHPWIVLLLVLSFSFILSACNNENDNLDPLDKGITFASLTVDGSTAYGEVANEVTSYSFLEEIKLSDGAEYSVSLDIQGMNTVPTKTVSLKPGDNTFYILATKKTSSKMYTVTIHRKQFFSVNFNTNGGSAVSPQKIEEGKLASVPTPPVKEGYTFVKWDHNFDSPITKHTYVTAQWKATTYKITYDANGGDIETTTQAVTYGDGYSLPTPTRAGYTFKGWYSKNIRYYGNGSEWLTPNDVTLTAKWDARIYYIRFENCILAANQYTIEDRIELKNPESDGYTFLGWTYEGQSTPELEVIIPSGSTGDKRFTANWIANVYKVTYDANGGTVTNKTQDITYGDYFRLETPKREGYTFNGWYNGENRY